MEKEKPQYKYNRRKPKQNFDINYDAIINDNLLNAIQKVLLIKILTIHKANKNVIRHILNDELCKSVVITTPTLIKHRQVLKSLNLFIVQIKVYGKMVEVDTSKQKNSALYYYPNWTKLKSLNFIIEHEEDEFKTRFNSKIQSSKSKRTTNTFPLKKGDSIMESSDAFKDDTLYSINSCRLDSSGQRIGIGNTDNMYGKTVKSLIKQEKNRVERSERQQNEYFFVTLVK